MDSVNIKTASGQLQELLKTNKDFPQKLKQRLISGSHKVENPFKFIVELFNEGVLCDGSSDLDPHFGFKEMLVQLAVTIGCSKGAEGIGGLVKALESSGNLQVVSDLQTWAKKDLGIESDDDGGPSEPEASTSAHQPPPTKTLRRNVKIPTEMSLADPPIDGNLGILKDADKKEIAKTSQQVKKRKLKKEKLSCRFCPRMFRMAPARYQHEHLHKKLSKCTYEACWNHPKTFTQPSSFRKHVHDLHAKIWEVEFCTSAELAKRIPKQLPATMKILRPKRNLRH